MSVAANAALVRRIMEAFANKEGFALRECFAEDAVWHVPGVGVMSGTYRGRSEIFRFLARLPKLTDGTYRSTFIDALASEEDRKSTRLNSSHIEPPRMPSSA